MPRLSVIEPDQATGKAKELFDGPLKGKAFNIFKGLANSGAALNAYAQLSGALAEGELTAAERESIALAVSEANGCDYCVAAHTAIGKGAGMSDDDAVAARKAEPADPRTRAIVNFAMALREKKGYVAADDLKAAKDAGLSDGAIAEIVANYALNVFTNYFNHVNETPSDFPGVPALA